MATGVCVLVVRLLCGYVLALLLRSSLQKSYYSLQRKTGGVLSLVFFAAVLLVYDVFQFSV